MTTAPRHLPHPPSTSKALHQASVSAVAIDLTRLHQRTVTSFYSNLVTRPTGRAVRSAVERQLAEAGMTGPCVSILDFTQVRVMDYSCADEIVAKLLLRYAAPDRPVDAYFLARGLQPEHLECVHAVLDRHDLLLATLGQDAKPELLGPASAAERRFWELLVERGRARVSELTTSHSGSLPLVADVVDRLLSRRVLLTAGGDFVFPLARVPEQVLSRSPVAGQER